MSERTAEQVTSELFEALGASLDVSVVLENAYPLLSRLISADYGALGVSSSGKVEDFAWSVAELPPAFFVAYEEMAAHDFVRESVVQRPNLVLRDQDMVPRARLEGNLMYRRAREVGAPIEHVMAVMLHADQRWQSGLSLYRARRRPFTAVERARLQRVTPALSNAVRNCHLLGVAAEWRRALERLLDSSEAAILLMTEDGREVARSARASRLLERWFEHEGNAAEPLPAALARVFESSRHSGETGAVRIKSADVGLEASFLRMPTPYGQAAWVLHLEERPLDLALPEPWRASLTAREQEVTRGVLRGWDNRLIGSELGCSTNTVKKHLQNVFAKLGVDDRAALLVRASRAKRR
ncbi:MAG: LuxR family transcriptional regulator [Myxococcales bacterium]|nr:MAG: LuxR family transcriptional regulator [Myxococcales bacterium]